MDLNGDGKLDILSGSYSRMEQSMAGLFQVLWGTDHGFDKATVLKGTDGKPLIITSSGDSDGADIEVICTRPTAVDLNGDGKLDIVAGNFKGTFAFFAGEGQGRFAPKSTWLTAGNSPLEVKYHSDPFFVDWDGDGDLDLISGGNSGGVVMFANTGSTTEPKFGKAVDLVPPPSPTDDDIVFGDAHIKGPQQATRVWAADVNGDGKLDLLVGDSASITTPQAGLDEATARARLADWNKEQATMSEAMMSAQNGDAPDHDRVDELQKKFQQHWKKREEIVNREATGFVWLYLQK